MRLKELHTTITLEGLLVHLDMCAVHESWADAAHFNARDEAERERQSKGRRR